MMSYAPFVKFSVGIAIGLYLCACLAIYLGQERLLFPGAFAPLPAELDGIDTRLGMQAMTISTADGIRLFALDKEPATGKPMIIVFHGNASYPESYRFLYFGWMAAGYGIVAPALRGYPRAEGTPDGEKMLADALDIYDQAVKTFPGHPVYVLGQSLGTAPAVHLAAHRSVEGLVLISPFKSMLSLAQSKMPYFPVGLLLKSPLRSDLDIAKVTAPVLILHGEQDELVPLESGRALAALIKHRVQFEIVPDAGHATGLFEPDRIDRINAFLGIDTQ